MKNQRNHYDNHRDGVEKLMGQLDKENIGGYWHQAKKFVEALIRG